MLNPGWQLIAILAWGVLTFGAVYPWAYWPLIAGCAAVGAYGVLGDAAWRDPRLARLGLALLALCLAIVVQIIALPAWLTGAISPGLDAFFAQLRVGYHPATLQTLSIDPAATRVVLAEVVALALLVIGVARLVRRWPLEWMAGQVMALAVAVALFGIVQRAVMDMSDPLIYGFWRPRPGGNPFGPFVNRNHFAGWMVMVVPLVAAYAWALVQRGRSRQDTGGSSEWMRWVSGVDGNRVLLVLTCVLVMVVSLIMTGSRSGMVACSVAMVVLLQFAWRTLHGATRWISVATVVLLLGGATLWAGAGHVVSRFELAGDDAGGRIAAWRDTWRIVRDFPLAGTGMGGYRDAMLVYQSGDRTAMYAQAHNDYLQVVTEGGLLVTVPAIVALGIALAGIRRRLRDGDADGVTFWLRRGAVAGLAGIAAQSVVEFSLQIPGNAAMCAALIALALHRPRSYAHAHRL